MRTSAFTLAAATLLGLATLPACVDDPELGASDRELSVWQWPDDTVIPAKFSTRHVALAPHANRLYMVFTTYETGTSTELKYSRWNGTSWSTALTLGVTSDSRPAATPFGDTLRVFYKPAGQARLMMKTLTGSSSWSSPVTVGRSLGSYSPYAPHAMEYDGKLYLTYCASNGTSSVVNIDRFDGTTWSAYKQITVTTNDAYLCQSALLAAMPDTGEVEVIWNIIDNNQQYGRYSSVARQRGVIGRTTSVWYDTELLPMKSYKPLSVVTCDGHTHLVHGGFSSVTEIWWSFREGGDWVTDAEVPNQWSSAGPTLGCYGTQTLLVHNESGSANRMMMSIFGP